VYPREQIVTQAFDPVAFKETTRQQWSSRGRARPSESLSLPATFRFRILDQLESPNNFPTCSIQVERSSWPQRVGGQRASNRHRGAMALV